VKIQILSCIQINFAAQRMKISQFLPVFIIYLVCSLTATAQDQIFLRNGDGILDCFILSVDDSIITFRTLDHEDKTEYEIPNSDTYGFLLEDPGRLQSLELTYQNSLIFSHPKKRRKPRLKPDKTVIYRLKSDTLLLPRRGKMISLTADSMLVETIKRKKVDRFPIALDDVIMFGYTTFMTELLTLVIVPASSTRDGTMQIFRKLQLSRGWTWKVMPPGDEELSNRKYLRKFRRGQLLNLPKSVRKKTLRDLRGK